jgi:L-ascorbate metabolism protein UlaG (beta-lactamase superfamily)
MVSITVKWIIHASFLLSYKDDTEIKIVVDPFLEPLGDKKSKELNELRDIDLLLLTHSHFDHLANACDILKQNKNTKYVAIFEIMNHIQNTCKVENEGIGMNIGGTWTYKKGGTEVPITMVHSHHSSDIGAPTGFIIQFPRFHIYHPGDTGLFTDMKIFSELYKIDLALLPIGGHFTMGIDEAVKAVELLQPKYVIPMHYKTFPVIEADPNIFKRRVEEEYDTRVVVLNPGEVYEFKL